MDPYAYIAQYPNAGEAFSNSFNKGMEQNALSAFAMNPNDPRAQAGAARYDPGAVAQTRQQQQALSAEHQKDWHAYAGQLAKWADNPQKWDEAVDYMVQQGHPEVAQLKGQFSPALRQSFMALGGVQDDRPRNPQVVPVPQGGGVATYDPETGQAKMLIQQNPGDHPTGAPVAPPVLTDEQMRQMMNGGQAGQSSPVPFR